MICRLKEKRLLLGVDQSQLARTVGVSRQTIWNIEHGSEPRVWLAIRIARHLGLAVTTLWDEEP